MGPEAPISLKRSYTPRCISNLELSVTQPIHAVAEDIYIWSVGPKRTVNPPPLFNCTPEILLLTYLHMT